MLGKAPVRTVLTWPQTIRPTFLVKEWTSWSKAGREFGYPVRTKHWGLQMMLTFIFTVVSISSEWLLLLSPTPEVLHVVLDTSEVQAVSQGLVVDQSLCGWTPVHICPGSEKTDRWCWFWMVHFKWLKFQMDFRHWCGNRDVRSQHGDQQHVVVGSGTAHLLQTGFTNALFLVGMISASVVLFVFRIKVICTLIFFYIYQASYSRRKYKGRGRWAEWPERPTSWWQTWQRSTGSPPQATPTCCSTWSLGATLWRQMMRTGKEM